MKLTCVTAVFNAIKSGNRENLIRCVKSVAALKTEHEHLIYDGASTDGTVELLRELERATPGLKVVSEKDTGIYNALNKGVRDAKGEWFYVLGCDDYICHPEVMDELIVRAGDAEIVATEVFLDNADGNRIRPIDYCAILRDMPYCHQGVIMCTDLVRKNLGFDERYKIAADYKLALLSHVSGAKVLYRKDAEAMFACFLTSGISEGNRDWMAKEIDAVPADVFGFPVTEMKDFRGRGYLPPRVFLRFVWNDDLCLKTSARQMFRVWLRRCVRIAFFPLVVITRPIRHRMRSGDNR